MIKKYGAVIALLLLITVGCGGKKISVDEEHLNMYFSEKHKMTIKDFDKSFIVVISGNCGSCTEKTIRFLKLLGDPNDKKYRDYKKIAIIPSNNAYVVDSIKRSTITFFVDEGYELEKYGINYPRNNFFEFKDNQLVYKDWLYLQNVDTVAKKYGFRL